MQGGSMSEAVLNGTGLKMSQQPYESLGKAFDAPVLSYAKRKGMKTARNLWHRLR